MRKPEDMRDGMRYKTSLSGWITIISYKSSKNITVRFDDTGHEVSTSSSHIRSGLVSDRGAISVYGVGSIGRGAYNSVRDKAAYQRWRNMMMRCYCASYQERQPTYRDCTVCEEWRNFQNFAEWFYNNAPCDSENYDLDKDLKVVGNKVYSPEFCSFIHRTEHRARTNERTAKLRSKGGEVITVTNIKGWCRSMGLNYGCVLRVLSGERLRHKGWMRA